MKGIRACILYQRDKIYITPQIITHGFTHEIQTAANISVHFFIRIFPTPTLLLLHCPHFMVQNLIFSRSINRIRSVNFTDFRLMNFTNKMLLNYAYTFSDSIMLKMFYFSITREYNTNR